MSKNNTMWVCLACGKRSRDRYGKEETDRGWDVSCFINSVLVDMDKVQTKNGRIENVPKDAIIEDPCSLVL